ncbi:MAG: multicopper oxidase domain-containing protein [Solirubrobacteraceae bacterium]|nr:multicopper oxidase domain-containing protein [Solirubrobacteraceae bacterium]
MPDRFTRRQALASAALGSLAFTSRAVGAPYSPPHRLDQPNVPGLGLEFKSPRLAKYVDDLPVLPRRGLGGDIVMAEARHRFHRDLDLVPSWGYDGLSHLGPTIEAVRREQTPTTFVNALGRHVMWRDIDRRLHGASELDRTHPPAVVHLHGAPNRPSADGHPMAMSRPGGRVTHVFGTDMEAAGLWYHDHAMGTTRLSLYAGLAGMFLLRDEFDTGETDNPLGLPAGEYEIPLVLTDKLFYPDGRLRYQGTPLVARDEWAGGLCGDVMIVNGKAWPRLEVDRGVYRFRTVNAAQINDYRLELSNGQPFWVIGSDGGLLDAPAHVAELDIAPGERYDLLIDFSSLRPGEHVDLLNTMRISWAGKLIGAVQVPNVMRFVAGTDRGRHRSIPNTLRGGTRQPARLPAVPTTRRVRTATLNAFLDRRNIRWISTGVMNMNNLTYADPEIEAPVQGTTERWDFVNCDWTIQIHAMHLHLVQFRVVSRQDLNVARYMRDNPPPTLGRRWAPAPDRYLRGAVEQPAPYEAGWKDTVRCPRRQVTSVIVRWPTADELGFDPDAPFTTPQGGTEQGYVWHCHVIDHEDHEMMLRLRITAPGQDLSDTAVPRLFCATT